MLTDLFNTVQSSHPQAQATPPGLIPPENSAIVPMLDCARGFQQDDIYYGEDHESYNASMSPVLFNYGIILEFEPGKLQDFQNSPTLLSDYETMKGIISETTRFTLNLENYSDAIDYSEHLQQNGLQDTVNFGERLYKDISPNRMEDLKYDVEETLVPLLKETFPDAGIVGASVGYAEGLNQLCRAPVPEDIMQASLDNFQTAFSSKPKGHTR